jgi:two-component system cell cycle sensor histidine kinase/response regulator CckA
VGAIIEFYKGEIRKVPTTEEVRKEAKLSRVPTVLVVDDEPRLRTLMRAVLEQDGFHVLTAENGRDAVTVSESHPGQIDLLVSDVKMPGMDGPTLAEELLHEDPNLPVLFVTGSSERLPLNKNEPFPYIEKPFSPGTLVFTVRKMLNRQH